MGAKPRGYRKFLDLTYTYTITSLRQDQSRLLTIIKMNLPNMLAAQTAPPNPARPKIRIKQPATISTMG